MGREESNLVVGWGLGWSEEVVLCGYWVVVPEFGTARSMVNGFALCVKRDVWVALPEEGGWSIGGRQNSAWCPVGPGLSIN